MKHLDNREDFRTDEEFANFRNLILANHKSITFFRSASAMKNKYGRASTVRQLMQKNLIYQIVDFSNVECQCMSDEFGFILVQKLRAILRKDPPYIIQCDAGKKRTGFVCLILEMLSGTNYTNIVNDYLESYKNNNGLNFLTNPEIAKEIEVQKIQKLICHINRNQDFEKQTWRKLHIVFYKDTACCNEKSKYFNKKYANRSQLRPIFLLQLIILIRRLISGFCIFCDQN